MLAPYVKSVAHMLFVVVLGQLTTSGDMFSRSDHRTGVNRILQPDTFDISVVVFVIPTANGVIRGYFPRLR